VNTTPDLFADLEIDDGSFDVVALDGMPFAFHDPSIHSRTLSHVLLAPAGRVEAIVTGPPALIRGFHCHLLNHEDKGMMAKSFLDKRYVGKPGGGIA
jgi:FtsP/CotA-like multicopper oxidase with cupredoxin domain